MEEKSVLKNTTIFSGCLTKMSYLLDGSGNTTITWPMTLFHIRVRIYIWKTKEIFEILERNWHSKAFKRTACMYNSAKGFGGAVIPRVSPRQSTGGGGQGAKCLEQLFPFNFARTRTKLDLSPIFFLKFQSLIVAMTLCQKKRLKWKTQLRHSNKVGMMLHANTPRSGKYWRTRSNRRSLLELWTWHPNKG